MSGRNEENMIMNSVWKKIYRQKEGRSFKELVLFLAGIFLIWHLIKKGKKKG